MLTFMYTNTLVPLMSSSICLVTSTRLSANLVLKSSLRSACAQADDELRPRCENPTHSGMLIHQQLEEGADIAGIIPDLVGHAADQQSARQLLSRRSACVSKLLPVAALKTRFPVGEVDLQKCGKRLVVALHLCSAWSSKHLAQSGGRETSIRLLGTIAGSSSMFLPCLAAYPGRASSHRSSQV